MADNGVLPRFFRVFLSESSTESFAIPSSFNQHLQHPLPKTAKLQYCGQKIWKVKMRKIQEDIYFTHGWRLFAEETDLKDGEFLTFVYDGFKTFEVSIYGRYGCKETRSLVNQQATMDIDDRSDSRTETDDAEIDDAEANSAMGDRPNPCFQTKIRNRKYELFIPANVVRDYHLRFGNCVKYIDKTGILEGTKGNWTDQRICFKGWNSICRRNKLKNEDTVSCELLHNLNLVHSIKITIIHRST